MPRESVASKRQRAADVVTALAEAYPDSTCALRHDSPFQLLIATMLSAQTTDVAVNRVTRKLFAAHPDAKSLAAADVDAVGEIIGSIGLWRAKSKNAVAAAAMLEANFDGTVPQTIAELTKLPGVGRKTATAVIGTAFGLPVGITVDTHMLRINRLLRLSSGDNPEKVAGELERLIPAESWNAYTHRIIDHGRLVCVARRPRCGVCPLGEVCPSAGKVDTGYRRENDERMPASAGSLSWLSVA